MSSPEWMPVAVVAALVLAAGAIVATLILAAAVRRSSARGSAEQAETLRWVTGELREVAVRMTEVGGSVHELGSVLKVPKLRGLMGERTLETMLGQVLPQRLWSTQHRFADGRIVDAVVSVGERLLPIDAKFPLEAFRRMVEAEDDAARRDARRDFVKAVRVRVAEIADRYIRPGEGTTDFALMFIPAEGVYAELLGGADGAGEILDEALGQRVVPVSPATIFAFLSVVATGMRGLEVEAAAREILSNIAAAEQEIVRLQEEVAVLGRHLHNATQRHAEVEIRLARVAERLAEVGRRAADS